MYEYKAKVLKVIDGDTIECEVDLGFHIKITERFRLLYVNAPETKGESKPKGEEAKQHLIERINGKEITIKTQKDDAFGRWLAIILLEENGNLTNINEEMIKTGHAVPYL